MTVSVTKCVFSVAIGMRVFATVACEEWKARQRPVEELNEAELIPLGREGPESPGCSALDRWRCGL